MEFNKTKSKSNYIFPTYHKATPKSPRFSRQEKSWDRYRYRPKFRLWREFTSSGGNYYRNVCKSRSITHRTASRIGRFSRQYKIGAEIPPKTGRYRQNTRNNEKKSAKRNPSATYNQRDSGRLFVKPIFQGFVQIFSTKQIT